MLTRECPSITWTTFIDRSYNLIRVNHDRSVVERQRDIIIYLLCWVLGPLNTLIPRQNGRRFPDDICKCLFLNEIVKFWLRFHRSWFLRARLTIFQHWFGWWLGVGQAIIWNNVCLLYWRIYTHHWVNWQNLTDQQRGYGMGLFPDT